MQVEAVLAAVESDDAVVRGEAGGDGAQVLASAARLSPEALALFNAELRALVAEGFTPGLALETISALSHHTTGYLLQEQSTPPPSDAPALPADSPLLEAMREGGGGFERGVRLIVAGAEVRVAGDG